MSEYNPDKVAYYRLRRVLSGPESPIQEIHLYKVVKMEGGQRVPAMRALAGLFNFNLHEIHGIFVKGESFRANATQARVAAAVLFDYGFTVNIEGGKGET